MQSGFFFSSGGRQPKRKKERKRKYDLLWKQPLPALYWFIPDFNIKLIMNVFLFCQERGLSLYEDQELKEYEDGEASTISLRDAISLAVPDETSSGTWNHVTIIIIQGA